MPNFQVWSPTTTDIKGKYFYKGSDDEREQLKVTSTNLRKEDASGHFGRLSLLANGKTTTTPAQSDEQSYNRRNNNKLKHRMLCILKAVVSQTVSFNNC